MKKNEMTKKLMEEFNEDFIDVGGVLDTTLPDPTMVEYYRRLKKREILWNDDISDATIDIALYHLVPKLAVAEQRELSRPCAPAEEYVVIFEQLHRSNLG